MEFGRRSRVSRARVVAVGHGFALISLVLCAVLLSPGSATAATGSIPGEFSVAPTGSATYTIPISVPPGLGGTQPNIAIQYNSQATNGWLGVGWNLSGLSEIRRCPQTYAQDNNWRGIAFDSGDRFCLDGQRLVAVAGEYGAGGTEYRSENDGYTKIVQSAGDCSGPCGFTVSTKSGEIREYGGTDDARLTLSTKPGVLTWAVNAVRDTSGNRILFGYDKSDDPSGHWHRISHIGYGDASGSLSVGELEFVYSATPRGDAGRNYAFGALMLRDRLLESIVVRGARGAAITTYRLGYVSSPSNGQSLLDSIQQCAGDSATDCLAPTELSWYGGSSAYKGWVKSSTAAFPADLGKCRYILEGDANGDGRTDLICVYDTDNSGPSDVITYVQLATENGYGAWQQWYRRGYKSGDIRGAICSPISPADVDGDGLTDLVCNSYGDMYVQRSTGSSYTGWTFWDQSASQVNPSCIVYRTTDVNGDGRSDVVCAGYRDTFVRLSRGNRFSPWVKNTSPSGPELAAKCRYATVADANGDGLGDVLCLYDTTNSGTGDALVFVQYAQATNRFTSWRQLATVSRNFDLEWCDKIREADLNGDGMVDFACASGNNYFALFSTGTDYSTWQFMGADGTLATSTCLDIMASDADGDGNDDLICPQKNIVLIPSGATYVKRSNADATGFGPWELWANSAVTSAGCKHTYLGDVDGNHMPDIVCMGNDAQVYVQGYKYGAPGTGSVGSSSGRVSIASYQPRDPTLSTIYLSGDLLQSIDDGIGLPTEVTYSTLADDRVYDPGIGSGCSGSGLQDYPILCRVGTPYVVVETRADDGTGVVAAKGYRYKRGRGHLEGRGFLGFGEVEISDDAAHGGKSVVTVYNQDFSDGKALTKKLFVLEGQVSATRVSLADGTLVANHTRTYTARATNNTRFEVLQTDDVEESFDEAGQLIKRISTVYQTYDTFGNPGRVKVTTTDGTQTFSKTTDSQYQNDPGNWILGRLTASTVTSVAPTGTGIRSSAFEYDGATGLLTAEIVEPADPDLYLRTEYSYDSYGNKESVRVSGSLAATYPIEERVATDRYDYANLAVDGTYTQTSTNALGHREVKTIDARFGQVVSLTGPNNLTTTWGYDGFGRKIREARADGTTTVWERESCPNGCPQYATHFLTEQATGEPLVTRYYDALEREIGSKTIGLNGGTIRKDVQFDARGRRWRESRNYFSIPDRYWITYQYDELDRVTQVKYPDGGVVRTSYEGLTIRVRSLDQAGFYDQTSIYAQDALGQEVEVIDAANQSLSKTYDAFGNLIRTVDPAGNVTLLAYDNAGRKISMDDPDMGHWAYGYDALGQLRHQVDATGRVVDLHYDLLGRMDVRQEQEGTTRWTFDSAVKGIGKLAAVTAPGGFSQSLTYDGKGRPKTDTRTLSGVAMTTTTNYNGIGKVSGTVYPSGFAVTYVYDTNGYLTRVRNAADTTEVYWQARDADADGNVTYFTLGNGLGTVRLYDPLSGRLTGISTGFGSGAGIQYLTYSYDALGNLRERFSTRDLKTLTERFGYDALNRMTDATVVGVGTATYRYDALGNITQKGSTADYRYAENGAGPHAVSFAKGSAYLYDGNGNQLSGGGRTLQWTSYNKPKSIAQGNVTLSFSYGPDRARFKQIRTVGGVQTVTRYFDKLYEQLSTGEKRHYIVAGEDVVAIYTQSGATERFRYLHTDHLGSTDAITDEGGNRVESASFDAFGAQRNPNWTTATGVLSLLETTRGFTGHEQLDGVGLVHMNGRVYDPGLGRFLSADPTVQFGSNAQSYNRYSYVLNNPLSATDPTGYYTRSVGPGYYLRTLWGMFTRFLGTGGLLLNRFLGWLRAASWTFAARPGALRFATGYAWMQTRVAGPAGALRTIGLDTDSGTGRSERSGPEGRPARSSDRAQLSDEGRKTAEAVESGTGRDGAAAGESGFANGAFSSAFAHLFNYDVHQETAERAAQDVSNRGYFRGKGEADWIYQNNSDPDLTIEIDASRLTVTANGGWGGCPSGHAGICASAYVNGAEYAVHGQGTVRLRPNGTYGFYDQKYDYEMHFDLSLRGIARNFGTFFGSPPGGWPNTPYWIHYRGNIGITNPYGGSMQ